MAPKYQLANAKYQHGGPQKLVFTQRVGMSSFQRNS